MCRHRVATNDSLHATIALFVPYGIHSATVADIFQLPKLTPKSPNIQSVHWTFYLVESCGGDIGVDLWNQTPTSNKKAPDCSGACLYQTFSKVWNFGKVLIWCNWSETSDSCLLPVHR
jgi:hypothetical protein